jgi:hypothetical protein
VVVELGACVRALEARGWVACPAVCHCMPLYATVSYCKLLYG